MTQTCVQVLYGKDTRGCAAARANTSPRASLYSQEQGKSKATLDYRLYLLGSLALRAVLSSRNEWVDRRSKREERRR